MGIVGRRRKKNIRRSSQIDRWYFKERMARDFKKEELKGDIARDSGCKADM